MSNGPLSVDDMIGPLNSEDLWASLYDDVLTPSFPAVELDDRETFLAALRSGELQARGVVQDDRVIAGVTLMRRGTVALVLYLALAPGRRGDGLGGALLDDAVHHTLDAGADVVLVEIEHPGHHEGSEEHGDPAARLRFYARHGVRLLTVPYFQPALGPGAPRVPALLLGTLGLSDVAVGSRRGSGQPTSVQAAPVREFVEHYFAASEGSLGDDKAMRRLRKALSGDEVTLVGPDDLDTISVGVLDDASRHAASLRSS